VLHREQNLEPPEIELNVVCKDGSKRHVLIRVSWVGEKMLVNFSDITAHWRSEQRNIAHDSILEMVAKGFKLKKILNSIVTIIEQEDNSALCSILLLDKEKKHLHNGAAPHLPEFYNEAIEGIEIGVGVGSCGTAAYLRERVVVEDIMTHEYWAPYTELAKSAGLGACWSEPIFATSGEVLGTFAIYHATRSTPTAEDMERIKFAANIAAIAIENKEAHEELEQQAYSDYLTGLTNRRAFIDKAQETLIRRNRYNEKLSLMMFDIDYFKHINDTYGHAIGDLVLQKIADVSRKTLRDVDIIGRIGGEEFAVLMPQTDMNEALNAAERLRMAFINSPVLLSENENIHYTASFGVVKVNDGTSIDTLLNQADNALYDAKKSGRNRVCSKSEIEAK
jgi:diguanylate cyclase (GGDEF)-like protein